MSPAEKLARNREYNRKWRVKNREKERARHRRWRSENLEYDKERKKKYAKDNKGVVNATAARYRAAKLQRTPVWSETKQIQGLYKLAEYLTETYGRPIHVDHVLPLQGQEVSGLHVIGNLQLLYAEDNWRKNNKYESLE